VAAFEDLSARRAGVQFHPEVAHTQRGQEMLRRFLYDIAGIEPTWTPSNIIDEQVAAIRAQVGDKQVICGLSGGVDSAVAAALGAPGRRRSAHLRVRRPRPAAGRRGRAGGEGLRGRHRHPAERWWTRPERFLGALTGVADPEQKRKIIGREFIRVFEAAAREVDAERHVEFLVQGTLYPDVVESGGGTGTANIKSHHNVGRPARGSAVLADRAAANAVQRRGAGDRRGAGPARGDRPAPSVPRARFGDPDHRRGRPHRLDVLRAADMIAREELTAAGLDREVWQFPVVLLADVRSVGVQGDGRTYGHPVVLRPGPVRTP
jgi:GMP synthase (glutamine-hydrolysing)